ncbi:MAG: DNA cytosine methyltransferase [Alphaproteobacteria bacterium]|nr:DNA cytosine methyltransferase [Alphaproteobacteria bacterium]
MTKPIKYFSGFANVGIGFVYAKSLGFECALANEYDLTRASWHQHSYPDAEMVVGDFTDPEVFEKLVRRFKELEIDVACFSPCCQPFSRAGGQHLDSPEAFYFLWILKFIERTGLKYAWIENAKEFPNAVLSDDPRPIKQRIVETLTPSHHVELQIQDAARFGTAQSRRRSLFLISRSDLPRWEFPKQTDALISAESVIGHLPPIWTNGRSAILMHNVPPLPKCQIDCIKDVPAGMWAPHPVNKRGMPYVKPKPKYAFRRIYADRPCNTILQKSASITGYQTLHYKENRVLSPLEIILLTGLPQNWSVPTWARCKHQLVRDVLGEAFAPRHVERLLQELLKIAPR